MPKQKPGLQNQMQHGQMKQYAQADLARRKADQRGQYKRRGNARTNGGQRVRSGKTENGDSTSSRATITAETKNAVPAQIPRGGQRNCDDARSAARARIFFSIWRAVAAKAASGPPVGSARPQSSRRRQGSIGH